MDKSTLRDGRKRAGESDVAGLLARAVGLHQGGSFAEAEALYRQILARDKNHFDALHFLGLLEAQRGHLADAHRLLGQAARRNPRSVEAHTNLGRVLDLLNRPEEALASYDKALAVDPHYVLAWNNRGSTLQALSFRERWGPISSII